MTPAVKSGIDAAQIPRVDVTNLSRTTLSAVERFYEDPQNIRRFEEWQKRRREKANGVLCS